MLRCSHLVLYVRCTAILIVCTRRHFRLAYLRTICVSATFTCNLRSTDDGSWLRNNIEREVAFRNYVHIVWTKASGSTTKHPNFTDICQARWNYHLESPSSFSADQWHIGNPKNPARIHIRACISKTLGENLERMYCKHVGRLPIFCILDTRFSIETLTATSRFPPRADQLNRLPRGLTTNTHCSDLTSEKSNAIGLIQPPGRMLPNQHLSTASSDSFLARLLSPYSVHFKQF